MSKTADEYTREMEGFAGLFKARFKCDKPQWVSYSGGVPGMTVDMADDKHHEVLVWLTMVFGEPELVSRWHPTHRMHCDVLRFYKIKPMQTNMMDHLHLIQKGTRQHKRHITITWM
jgi:hypothetical protein